MTAVSSLIDYFSKLWKDCPEDFPEFGKTYNVADQKCKELMFLELQDELNKCRSNKRKKEYLSGNPGNSIFPILRRSLQDVFDFDPSQLDIILSDQFRNVSKDFFYAARQFGPELSAENIYQGMRNVWIMNGIQLMMGIPVEITPSVFAYSMIYPYSDNLLDGTLLSSAGKHAFNVRFNKRLHGQNPEPENFIEQQLYRLVSLIEDQYPRNDFPKVYESLYAIQQGQANSLQLLNNHDRDELKIIEICFEKGGASVLADGYLVAGNLTEEQERALFGYGIYLQLLDDIQDIKEDSHAHTRTLFACLAGNSRLEPRINKTFHFGRKILEALNCFTGTDMNSMLLLMNHSIESMIVESVGLHTDVYYPEWLQEMEVHSPLRFDFLRKMKAKSKSQRLDLFKSYFNSVSVKAASLRNNFIVLPVTK